MPVQSKTCRGKLGAMPTHPNIGWKPTADGVNSAQF